MVKGQKTKKHREELKKEFKKATSTAIMAALGLVIGLAWMDVITGFVEKITSVSPIQGKLISALVITVIGVLGIWLTTKAFKSKE